MNRPLPLDTSSKYSKILELKKTLRNDLKNSFYIIEIQNKIIEVVFYSSEKKLRVNKIKSETLIQVMNHMWTNFCRFLPYKLNL